VADVFRLNCCLWLSPILPGVIGHGKSLLGNPKPGARIVSLHHHANGSFQAGRVASHQTARNGTQRGSVFKPTRGDGGPRPKIPFPVTDSLNSASEFHDRKSRNDCPAFTGGLAGLLEMEWAAPRPGGKSIRPRRLATLTKYVGLSSGALKWEVAAGPRPRIFQKYQFLRPRHYNRLGAAKNTLKYFLKNTLARGVGYAVGGRAKMLADASKANLIKNWTSLTRFEFHFNFPGPTGSVSQISFGGFAGPGHFRSLSSTHCQSRAVTSFFISGNSFPGQTNAVDGKIGADFWVCCSAHKRMGQGADGEPKNQSRIGCRLNFCEAQRFQQIFQVNSPATDEWGVMGAKRGSALMLRGSIPL